MTSKTLTAIELDPKRYAWMIALVWGFLPLIFMGAAEVTGQPNWVWTYFLLIFGLMPLLDNTLGADSYNPPESEYRRLRDDKYYDWVARITALAPYVSHIAGALYIANNDPHWFAYLGFAMVAGYAMGLAVNASHEVGHKNNKVDQWFARLGLVPSIMGHFRIEHNFGHHIEVATPEDTATARMGQNYYQFVLREIPGGIIRAYRIEAKRLKRKNKLIFGLGNEVVFSALLSLVYYSILVWAFGWGVLAFLLISALQANLLLSSANYIEHYGLLRQKLPNGKYEPCKPHHSWNSNRYLSNLIILNLERHSDHHAFAQRPYQCLRHYDEVPQLPMGYLPMFALAWFPPLWYKVMDKRVAKWADGDMTKVLMQPSKREKLFDRWHNPTQGTEK